MITPEPLSGDLLSETQAPYTAEDSGQFKTIVVFECRGLDLLRFSPRVGWTARGVNSGTLFNDVSLTDSVAKLRI
ncbi:hypothetical protein P879_07818 [Paragonimus westermani]|uniref:Uncharacterized protein n=1 Tax=Paragonimus westermani TaxID=34504 RepID=A0A8T0DUB1_9TREM|nr:hypothetical protein P879_07818 [Paragonimus westermani]